MATPEKLPFKISVLIFVRDEQGRHLLIERQKEPNKGLCSPIGGKLEMSLGESPFECAIRETQEEISLSLCEDDLHLFAMVSEKSYEGGTHWLMFLFDCKKRITSVPKTISEGAFRLVSDEELFGGSIAIPETDRLLLWDIWQRNHNGGFSVLRADCSGKISAKIEESI